MPAPFWPAQQSSNETHVNKLRMVLCTALLSSGSRSQGPPMCLYSFYHPDPGALHLFWKYSVLTSGSIALMCRIPRLRRSDTSTAAHLTPALTAAVGAVKAFADHACQASKPYSGLAEAANHISVWQSAHPGSQQPLSAQTSVMTMAVALRLCPYRQISA